VNTVPQTHPSVLPAATAMHTLLSQHPHLADLPLGWDIRPDHQGRQRVSVSPTHMQPGGIASIHQIAAALGTETTTYTVGSRTEGPADYAEVRTELDGGVPIHAWAYELAEQQGGAE
jgi:hypothetical protein